MTNLLYQAEWHIDYKHEYNDGTPGSCKVPWLYHMLFYRAFSRTCIEWESFMPIPNRILFASCLRQVCPLQSQQLLVEESPVSSYNALTLAVTFCMLIQGKRFLETCIGCLLPIRYCLIVWSGVLACGGESSFFIQCTHSTNSKAVEVTFCMLIQG